jgi:hypothetical protein
MIKRLPWSTIAFAVGAAMLMSCAGGYVYGDGVGVDLDYYQPYGYYGGYDGGWEPGYVVGPVRGGDHRFDHGGGHDGGRTHAFRPAPASRPMPSIPTGGRGGGHRH